MSDLFKTTPFEHQLKAYERFKDEHAYALFWEMGTGKTKTTIDIAVHKFVVGDCNRFVLIAPNTVHSQWINEQLPVHCGIPYRGFVYETKSTDKYLDSLMHFVVSAGNRPNTMHWLAIHAEAFQYDKIEKVLHRFLYGQKPFWIVDEATRIKNPEAKSVQRLCKLRRTYGGAASILTGTSMAKSPVDVWQMIEFIRPSYMGCSHTAFKKRHAILTKHETEIVRGGRQIKVKVDISLSEKVFFLVKNRIRTIKAACMGRPLDFNDYTEVARQFDLSLEDVQLIEQMEKYGKFKNIDQLKIQLSPISSALKKEECLDLPNKVYQEIVLELSPEQKKILHDMKKYAVAMHGDKELSITHKASLQIRALQVCGGFFPHLKELSDPDSPLYDTTPMEGKNAKLDYLRHDIEELGDTPFIVWAVFVPELRMLEKEIGKLVSTALLSGDTPKTQREEIRQGFQNGEIQCLVANPVVAGYGLNFQHALVQYWYSRNYRTEARLQAEDRSHRIGIVDSPLYKDLVYNATFERKVLQNNKEGKEMNQYFMQSSVEELFSI